MRDRGPCGECMAAMRDWALWLRPIAGILALLARRVPYEDHNATLDIRDFDY